MTNERDYIDRPLYVDQILAHSDTRLVKLLTGVRRCGKSTILRMVQSRLEEKGAPREAMACYRMDSMEYEGMTAREFYEMLKGALRPVGRTYFFLDEVQEIEGWEKAVNSIVADYDVDMYITGSNSRMLSSEIATYLTGRYVAFRIYPLSFREYLDFVSARRRPGPVREEFSRYLMYGGFPAIHLYDHTREEVYQIVRDIYSSTVFSDIVRRNEIRRVDLLERIVKFVFDNIGNTFSAGAIQRFMKSEGRRVDVETVYSYLDKLERAYIIHRCPRYDLRGRQLLSTNEKYFVSDLSFVHSVLGYRPQCVAGMLENLAYLELLRRGYQVQVGKLDGQREVDFIAQRQNERIYLQITLEIARESTLERELAPLFAIDDNYPKYLLRTDDFAQGNYRGVRVMHLADFLLSREF